MTDVIVGKVSRLPQHSDYDVSSLTSTAHLGNKNVEQLWKEMKARRQRLFLAKQNMANERKALRDLRRRKDEADNSFMNMLRLIFIEGRQGLLAASHDSIKKSFAEMQSLRFDYHWHESNYEKLELTLDDEEETLNNIETRFFSLLAAGSTRDDFETDSADESEEEEASKPHDLMGISRDGPADDTHPLWQDLVSAIGDLNNAREEHDQLLRDHGRHAYDIKIKTSVGSKPTAEEIEFMDEFPTEERKKREDVERLTDEVDRLRRLCEQKGAMKKHPPFIIAYALDPNIGEDMSLDDPQPDSKARDYMQFPELVSCPDFMLQEKFPPTVEQQLEEAEKLRSDDPSKRMRLHEAKKELDISTLLSRGFKNKSDFITQWLLHHLRTSPLAVELLYATFGYAVRLRIQNRHRWQKDVLFHWWRDGAVRPPETFIRPLTGSGVASPDRMRDTIQPSVIVEPLLPASASSKAVTEASGRAFSESMLLETAVH
ncbi:hypothetical protein CMUS01_02990 [Colletotrichum musicola]|uniref:Uncharacterized protein n=1 Tax=Colletotrichum musicola TaxID=2175873 RepID=A0A8H6NU41_9PEZI|nr:hypothetical protein CMUS01_02990 [Colletotrichum musicola]